MKKRQKRRKQKRKARKRRKKRILSKNNLTKNDIFESKIIIESTNRQYLINSIQNVLTISIVLDLATSISTVILFLQLWILTTSPTLPILELWYDLHSRLQHLKFIPFQQFLHSFDHPLILLRQSPYFEF